MLLFSSLFTHPHPLAVGMAVPAHDSGFFICKRTDGRVTFFAGCQELDQRSRDTSHCDELVLTGE